MANFSYRGKRFIPYGKLSFSTGKRFIPCGMMHRALVKETPDPSRPEAKKVNMAALGGSVGGSRILACVAGGILSRVRGQREAMAAEPPILAAKPREASGETARFQSGSFPFSSRLRHPYSLATVKLLRRTRTIP